MSASAAVARSAPSLSLAGPGSARAVMAAHRGTRTMLVVDDAVRGRVPVPSGAWSQWTVREAPTRDRCAALAEEIVDRGTETVIVVGGGSAMDVATLAAAMAADTRLNDHLAAREDTQGYVVAPSPPTPPVPLVVIPTTVGTGAEVSSTACYERRGRTATYKVLVSLPMVRASTVVHDPEMLAGPSWLVREGAVEILIRLLSAAAESPSTLLRADEEAEYLLRALATRLPRLSASDGVGVTEPCVLEDLATLSADSHRGWALAGRGTAPSSLWFVANELSMRGGLRKAQAMRLLLPGWLDALASPSGPWGAADRTDHLWRVASGGTPRESADAWLESLVPAPGLEPQVGTDVVARVLARFGGGRPMSRRVTHDVLTGVLDTVGRLRVGSPA